MVHELGIDVSPFCRNLYLNVLSTTVDGGVVHVNHVLALLAVALESGCLHILNGVLCRDDACDSEECTLEDGVSTSAQTDFCSYLGSVDDIEVDVLAANH